MPLLSAAMVRTLPFVLGFQEASTVRPATLMRARFVWVWPPQVPKLPPTTTQPLVASGSRARTLLQVNVACCAPEAVS